MPISGTIPGNTTQEPADLLHLALPMSQKVILVIDLVESVRLMASDEAGIVARWHDFVRHAQTSTIPAHQGRLVKSLGDGLMIEFDQAGNAYRAAQALHNAFAGVNTSLPAGQQMNLRAGINSSQVYTDQIDVYGAGVNLAARLATLAEPGETVVSASVRDGLTDGLDASIEDMGECYLKHIEAPVRAYRLGTIGADPVMEPRVHPVPHMEPTIAVIPFAARTNNAEYLAVGDLIADGVIAQLGRTASLKVVARMSSSAFRHREASGADIKNHLGADYLVTGSHVVAGGRVVITAMLTASQNDHVIWTDRFQGDIADLLEVHSELCQHIANATHMAVLNASAQQALTRPMPTLNSQTLMLGGINLMHRSAPGDFLLSRKALDALVDRHPRAAACRAWLAKWYVLNATRGLTNDPQRDAHEALNHTTRALAAEPSNSLALAMEGFVHLHLKKDLPGAVSRLETATQVNPNDALAWLFRGVTYAFQNEGEQALQASQTALTLSPLDPLRYYFEALTASSAIAAGNYAMAVDLCNAAIRRNHMHAHTYRALILAYWSSDQPELARQTAQQLLKLAPQTSVERFLGMSASADYAFGKNMANAMRASGIPDR
jgi:adenylate cyclase